MIAAGAWAKASMVPGGVALVPGVSGRVGIAVPRRAFLCAWGAVSPNAQRCLVHPRCR